MIVDPKKNVSDMMPEYVNDTLDAAARRRLENVMENSPSTKAEVSWLQRVREQMQGCRQRLPAADAGLDRLMALIDAEKAGKLSALAPRAKSSIWHKPALAIAASVMLVQAMGLFTLIHNGPAADTIRTLAGATVPAQGASLQVTFKAATTEAQMRASLALVDGEIIGGPGVLGVYTVRVKKGLGLHAADKLLQQKSVIESAIILHD